MTKNETRCFEIIKGWKRKALWRSLKSRVVPILPGRQALQGSGVVIQIVYILFFVAFLPFILLWWILRAAVGLIIFPIEYLKTFHNINKIRAPGERNIQGIHNAFNKYYNLPIDFYLNCVDEWISILYPTQAPHSELSIKQHIDPQIISYHSDTKNIDQSFHDYAKSQVSRAREEISKELGYYR